MLGSLFVCVPGVHIPEYGTPGIEGRQMLDLVISGKGLRRVSYMEACSLVCQVFLGHTDSAQEGT